MGIIKDKNGQGAKCKRGERGLGSNNPQNKKTWDQCL